MTRSKFLLRDGTFYGFVLDGHSGYAAAGADIVCAAVSSAAYLTVNTITAMAAGEARVAVDDGHMVLRLRHAQAAACQALLVGFYRHMRQLERQYPDQIHVTLWRCKRHAENRYPAVRP